MAQMRSVRGFASGRVQGVGFRYFVKRQAEARQVRGYVRNLRDGRVEFLLQGEADAIADLVDHIRHGPSHARVTEVRIEELEDTAIEQGFVIR
ncbi:MAG: acylphosphatase [Gammaproteobacteria bacterium]|nr:acylphosphatase [Gammaproteobacteria bacterium]MDH3446768.1 acylphosphatase [Gammaproteobacteria bacterium]